MLFERSDLLAGLLDFGFLSFSSLSRILLDSACSIVCDIFTTHKMRKEKCRGNFLSRFETRLRLVSFPEVPPESVDAFTKLGGSREIFSARIDLITSI